MNGTIFVIFSFNREKYIFPRDQYFKRETISKYQKI